MSKSLSANSSKSLPQNTKKNKSCLELIFSKDVAYADSRVIAEYYGKQHKHVLRDIEVMLQKLDLISPDLGWLKSIYKDSKNREYPCYQLDFDLTMTLITGYDTKLRYQLVKDWHRMDDSRNKKRLEAKSTRVKFTDSLQEHGCKGYDYMHITNNMKKPFEISKKHHKGDFDKRELKLIEAAEHVATILLDDEEGYRECNETCVNAAESIVKLADKKKKIEA